MNYYTYAYLREDGTPYYVGKGKGSRAHLQLNHKVKTPERNRVLYLKEELTEEEAYQHEKYMIAVLGRKDLGTGILRNLTDGGEGISGYNHTEETKKKMRRPNSVEHNRKVSEAIKEKWDKGEYDRETYRKRELGKKQSVESSIKKSNTMKEYYKTNKKVISEEQKRQIGQTLKEKYKNGYVTPTKGKKSWNNGKKEVKCIECPGEGWVLGGLSKNIPKGTKWWNDGQINKRSVECPGKDFVPGRMSLRPYNRG